MTEGYSTLPKGCVLRPYYSANKGIIQKLVWEFIKAEATGFFVRRLGYRLLIVLGLILTIIIQLGMSAVESMTLSSFLQPAMKWNFILIFLFTSALMGEFLLIFRGALLNWKNYWLIECNNRLVAYGAVSSYKTHSVISNLYVKPTWRDKDLDSYLVRHLIGQVTGPLYLVCKPKMIQFYEKFGFVQVQWQELPPPIKVKMRRFRPHPKLRSFHLAIMQYKSKKLAKIRDNIKRV
jgi:amino-acid N-acetyltransferase